MMTETNMSADAIERDIEQTQNQISDTVDQLQRRLNPRALIDAVLGDEEQSPQQLLNAARTNPVAVGLIGAGALLLASGRAPSLGWLSRRGSSDSEGVGASANANQTSSGHRWLGRGHHDPHVSYVEYMAKVEQREGEDDIAYTRRRDIARANYFMLDRHHDEDEGSFRTRLNEAQAALRSKTAAFGAKARRALHDGRDGVHDAGTAVGESGRAAWSRARDWTGRTRHQAGEQFERNPAVGGLIAAALGAIVGAALPPSETERRQLGSIGEQARDMIAGQADKAVGQAVDKADALLDQDGKAGGNADDSDNAYAAFDGPQPTTTQA